MTAREEVKKGLFSFSLVAKQIPRNKIALSPDYTERETEKNNIQ